MSKRNQEKQGMASAKSLQHFASLKFGLFLHWGLYAIPGGRWDGQTIPCIGEWFQAWTRMPDQQYAGYADQFNPVDFDAEGLVRTAAETGMKYLVFTAKHHDGFAMYHSRVSPFNIVDGSPFRRDPLRELADACAKYGMPLGIYYSQNLDWHEKDGGDPGPDYPPNVCDLPWGNNWDFPDWKGKHFERFFRNKVIPQVTELLLGYGPVLLMWFDCPLSMDEKYSRELYELVHRLQPECLVNMRVGNNYGDYGVLGDNQLLAGRRGNGAFESPGTLNGTWGFKYDDHRWKSAHQVIDQLLSLAEKNSNYLLNIGPMANGALPPECLPVLKEVAHWYRTHAEGLRGTTGSGFPQTFDFAYCTTGERKLFFYLRKPLKTIEIYGIRTPILRAGVPFEQNGAHVRLTLPDFGDEMFPLIELVFASAPEIDQSFCEQSGSMSLPAPGGRIEAGSGTGHSAGTGTVSVAGEYIPSSGHMAIAVDGSLRQWHNPEDRIMWRVRFPGAGRFEASMVTKYCWSDHWTGDRQVELSFNGRRIVTTLCDDKLELQPGYAQAESKLGIWEIQAGEEGEMILRTLKINSAEAEKMHLVCLRFDRQASEPES